jgi:hypothetical protein
MRTLQRLITLSLLTLTVPASAHGIHGHIHVTGWAIENLPAGELRDFFMEPEVMNAALFGAAFTDSGYWPLAAEMEPIARAYSEHTHWEPFIADVVAWQGPPNRAGRTLSPGQVVMTRAGYVPG